MMARGMDHIELNWRLAHSSQQEHRSASITMHVSLCRPAGDHSPFRERGHIYWSMAKDMDGTHSQYMMDGSAPLALLCMHAKP